MIMVEVVAGTTWRWVCCLGVISIRLSSLAAQSTLLTIRSPLAPAEKPAFEAKSASPTTTIRV